MNIEKNKTGEKNPVIDSMLDKLNFSDKISIIEKNYALHPSSKSFVKMAWKIKDFRNEVAHGRFDKLNYKGYSFADPRGPIKIDSRLNECGQRKMK